MQLEGANALRAYWANELQSRGRVDVNDTDSAPVLAGVDEAGRGPLAGPVVAAAVVVPADAQHLLAGCVRDSKAMTHDARTAAAALIHAHCTVGVGIVEAEDIDRLNILQATLAAMLQSITACGPLDGAVIDGNRCPVGPSAAHARFVSCVKGDGKFIAIAAASIVAKVARDEIMTQHAAVWPDYGFDAHKGYGTRAHLQALRRVGPCALHRRSFKPVRESIAQRAPGSADQRDA